MSADAEMIRRAAELIEKGGLCKGHYHQGEAHCTVGALREVSRDSQLSFVDDGKVFEAEDLVAVVALEQFRDRLEPVGTLLGDPFVTVTRFNDHKDTTADDVVMVLEKAAVRAEEYPNVAHKCDGTTGIWVTTDRAVWVVYGDPQCGGKIPSLVLDNIPDVGA